MQIVVNKDLSIAVVEPEEINQGSSNADFLSIFAPFSVKNYTSLLVYFELPNGEVLKPRVAFATATMPNGIGVWSMALDAKVAEQAGEVKCQLGFVGGVDASTEKITEKRTAKFNITVSPGINPELPETPTYNIYQEILSFISQNIELENAKLDKIPFTPEESGKIVSVGEDGGLVPVSLPSWVGPEKPKYTASEIEGAVTSAELATSVGTIRSTAIKIKSYNETTGEITFTDLNGENPRTINLFLESEFSNDSYFDNETNEFVIVLLSGKEIRIPAGDILDVAWVSEINDDTSNSQTPPTTEAVYNYHNATLVLKKGEGNNSAVQISVIPNTALSESASAFGSGTVAGLRGYKIIAGSSDGDGFGVYTLEGEMPSGISTELTVDYSVQIGSNYDRQGRISGINVTDGITYVNVTNYVAYDSTKSPNIFWLPDYPNIGEIDIGVAAHAEGYDTKATMLGAHAEGYKGHAYGKYAHVEGYGCEAGYSAHAEGRNTKATKDGAHAEGYGGHAYGKYAHVEGNSCEAGYSAHAEGRNTKATDDGAHAEGCENEATAGQAHAEGYHTTASGHASHAEGFRTNAITQRAHAEGYRTTASGSASHAEGYQTEASGDSAHAEGKNTVASGVASHAAGTGTKAKAANQTVVGQYNADDPDALFIVGNGEDDNNRSNAFVIRKNGTMLINGNIVVVGGSY